MQSLLSDQQHPAAHDEDIKNAWLRPDGLTLRRERGKLGGRESGGVNLGARKMRKEEKVNIDRKEKRETKECK